MILLKFFSSNQNATLLTLQHKSPVRNAIRPWLDSRSNSNQGEGAGLSIGSFGAVSVSIYQHALLCTLFSFFFGVCVCVLAAPFQVVKSGLCFHSALMTAFISPACTFPPSLSGWYPINSLGHVQCRSFVLAAKGKKKKNPSQGPAKNSWLALLLFPPCSFLFFLRVSFSAVQPSCWKTSNGRVVEGGEKMSGSPCHGASNQRGESSGFPF